MNRPLLVTDCDEVLLHMASHFGAWLDEAHGIDFALDRHDTFNAMTRRADGSTVPAEEAWPLLDAFFQTEMHRQTPVPHAIEALGEIAEHADIVVLTNIGEHCRPHRMAHLESLGIRHRVLCNSGGKGRPVARLIEELRPGATVFVDDLAVHHESVAKHAPDVWRLHLVAEPRMAPHIPAAPHAHARIDDWVSAKTWVLDRLAARAAA
ncbi:hypothetical protein [Sphingomonas fennica]|uniref:HAD family hydrolase n=1 Tax=Edaphosphingomonas fennica TaxID=114404 RepID=A0A2T4HPP2_9SPHN|nr:hypothetical protein [Sphingomonas fennica]PTD17765.1 hypothetical protein CV103_16395 [Sphingomonas fennica]